MKQGYIVERRYAPLDGAEFREDGAILNFRGHAAVFNQLTDLGPWREQIAPGAFKKTIKDGADVRFLYNHEPDSVMARTKNGTLRLAEDKLGLMADADLSAADWDVQRLAPKLKTRNVDQMSFAFRVVGAEGEEWNDDPEDGGKAIRTLKQLALYDVSAVTFPAYPQTDGGLRESIEAVAERRGMVVTWDDETETPVPASDELSIFTAAHLTNTERLALETFVNSLVDERASGASRDLPIADKGGGWDAAAAKKRVQAWAGGDEWSPVKYRKAFLYYDADAPELLGSYKLPFADIKGSSLTAIPEGIYAAAQRLDGTDIPDADKARARSILSSYYRKMDEVAPWDRGADDAFEEERETADTKDSGADGSVAEDVSPPPCDCEPAAPDSSDGSGPAAPLTYDAKTLWARIAQLKTTL